MTLGLSFCSIITGNTEDAEINPACNGQYTFIQFIASAVCYKNPLTTGRYLGIKTTEKQFLQLCEVEVYSRGNRLILKFASTIGGSTLFFSFDIILMCLDIQRTCHFIVD